MNGVGFAILELEIIIPAAALVTVGSVQAIVFVFGFATHRALVVTFGHERIHLDCARTETHIYKYMCDNDASGTTVLVDYSCGVYIGRSQLPTILTPIVVIQVATYAVCVCPLRSLIILTLISGSDGQEEEQSAAEKSWRGLHIDSARASCARLSAGAAAGAARARS